MSRITITRSNEWNNRLRGINIFIDGNKVGSIANGETKSFEVGAGQHTLKAKIDWAGSRELPVSVAEGEKKYFSLSGYRLSKILTTFTLAIVVLHLILSRIYHIEWLIWLVVPAFLVLIYYLSFGRNDYLRLRETEGWMK